jgi:hypothetical protein
MDSTVSKKKILMSVLNMGNQAVHIVAVTDGSNLK